MPIPSNELTDIDFRILEYINKFPSVSKSQILAHIKADPTVIEHSLSVLSRRDVQYVAHSAFSAPESSYIVAETVPKDTEYGTQYERTNQFHISELGKFILQEHTARRRQTRRELLFKSVIIPIIVSLITNLIIVGTKQLFPTLQEWLSHIP